MPNQVLIDAAKLVGGQAVLARALKVKAPTVNQWANGHRPVPVQFCHAIEVATGGAVTRKQLRPDDWHRIWPETPKATKRRAKPAEQQVARICSDCINPKD